MHILFTRISLLQEQKLTHNKYSEHDINMSNFVKATEHDVHMYEWFGDLYFYRFLQLNTPRFDL
jgi:hypothetical protein